MPSSPNVAAAIARRCPSPEWALFHEVGEATGGRATRRADAVAMNCWPSRGLALHGFEIKVARGDWLRELKDPAKSAPVQRYCDRWWVAVSDDKIVREGELPEAWGLLVLRGRDLVQAKEAPVLTPEPLDRPFIASLLRGAVGTMVEKSIVDELVAGRVDEAVKRAVESSSQGWQIQRLEKRLEEEQAKWAGLTAVVGHDIVYALSSSYRTEGDRVAMRNAIRFVAAGGLKNSVEHMGHLAARAREIAERLDEAAAGAAVPAPAGFACDTCGSTGGGVAGPCSEIVAFAPCQGTVRAAAQ